MSVRGGIICNRISRIDTGVKARGKIDTALRPPKETKVGVDGRGGRDRANEEALRNARGHFAAYAEKSGRQADKDKSFVLAILSILLCSVNKRLVPFPLLPPA